MDITMYAANMDDHTPQFLNASSPTRRLVKWYWLCACGTRSTAAHPSKETMRLDHLRHHVFPDARPPDHTPAFYRDEVGAYCWSCTCGTNSYASGHKEDRRARQSHTRHIQVALLDWYDALASDRDKLAQRISEEQERMERLRPDQREMLISRHLEEIL